MFLIAKIVRGRRLLHQLEQEVEREKAARALEQREKLLFNSRAMPDQAADELGASSSACPYAVGGAGGEAAAAISAGGDMELPEMGQEMTKAALDQQQLEQIRRRRQRAAVRQRTDSSLPSEDADQLLGSKSEQAMRRTSSMPSIVESGEQISHHHRHQLHHNLSIYPRRGPRPVRHYNYEDKLTKLQKRALRFTWQRLLTRNGGKRIENVFEEVFERMMRSLPIMREMFNTRTFISAMSRCEIASPRDHARLIVKMFEAAIKNLEMEPSKRTDTESDFDPKLLGQAHSSLRPYGFTSTLWEAFGEAVIDIVLNQEAVRDLPGASQAWVVLTACMVDQLRAGFESVRECPFKNMRSQKEGQQNGGGQMESGGRVSSPSNLPEESCQSPQRQLGEGLHRLNTARRRTITAADQEGLLEQGQHTLSGDGHPFQQPCARERRCFSIMPLNSAANGSSASAHHHSRVQLKFLQDMASTEL